jgi:hypothetical protein
MQRFGLLLALHAMPCLAGAGGVKSIFLNGIDISSARNQELKNVDVLINEQGDIFLLAPHYQVNEEDTYVPLSKYAQGLGPIAHKPPQPMRSAPKAARPKDQSQKSQADDPKTAPAQGPSNKADPGDEAKAKPTGIGNGTAGSSLPETPSSGTPAEIGDGSTVGENTPKSGEAGKTDDSVEDNSALEK